jgi:serine/threonine protein kinase
VPISFTLRYAAPETVAAFQQGRSTSIADTAVDVFAFGIMCYELLTRAPYYPSGVNGQEVGEMLAGNKLLPHETMSETNSRRLGVLRECAFMHHLSHAAAMQCMLHLQAMWGTD